MRRVLLSLVLAALPVVAHAASPVARWTAQRAVSDTLVDALEDGQYATVETRATQLLADIAAPPTDSTLLVRVWTTLLDTWTRNGKTMRDTTTASAARIVALAERVTPGTPLHAQLLQVQGAILLGRARYADARDVLLRADAILDTTVAARDPRRGWCQSTLGNAYQRLGEPAAAQAHYRRALDILLAAYGEGDTRPARVATNLAFSLHSSGDDAAAREAYAKALAIFERALPPTHPDLAVILGGYGAFLKDTGDLLTARDYLQRALAIREASAAPSSPAVARVLFNLSTVRLGLADTTGAREGHQRALAMFRAAEGNGGGPFTALTLCFLGEALVKSGDFVAARGIVDEARALRLSLGRTEDADVMMALYLGAYLDMRAGHVAAARAALDTCATINQRVHGATSQTACRTRASFAAARWADGDLAGAAADAWQAMTTSAAQTRALVRMLPERQALLAAGQAIPGYDLTIDLATHGADAARAFDAVVRTRALVLDELAARAGLAHANADTAATHRWEDAARDYSRLLVRGPGSDDADAYRARVEAARLAFEAAEAAIASRRAHAAHEDVGLAEVARALPAQGAVIGYVRYLRATFTPASGVTPTLFQEVQACVPRLTPAYAAFVLRAGDAQPRIVPLGEAGPIDSLATRWQAQMADAAAGDLSRAAERASRRTGAALRRRVWDPLAPLLRGTSRVFVVPDGALHRLAFDALPTGTASYLVETGPLLHLLSAERDLVRATEAPTDGRGLLAVGDIDFDAPAGAAAATVRGGACEARDALRFAPLPGTGAEAREIATLWRRAARGDARLLARRDATESAIKSAAPGRAVLHLATHGFFLDDGCAREATPALRGIGGMRPHDVAIAASGDNPLALAGLACAGANRHAADGEDGVLTAQEIAALDLRGVQWAVISACESGSGAVQLGEGVLGVRRAFAAAGARTTITSLWPVRDDATARWMRAAYGARVLEGRDTAAAMQAACRAVLRDRRAHGLSTHPAAWAAFVAAGDWR